MPFDLGTVSICVCRQAGYFEHAAYLAKRWSRNEDYLRILIEDTRNFNENGCSKAISRQTEHGLAAALW